MTKHATSRAPLDDLLGITRALGDPGRLRILAALKGRELCVCQLVELLGLAPSTVSRHLSALRRGGLAEPRKNGRWVFYRRPGAGASPAVRGALAWVDRALGDLPETAADRRRLGKILSVPAEELCRRMNPV